MALSKEKLIKLCSTFEKICLAAVNPFLDVPKEKTETTSSFSDSLTKDQEKNKTNTSSFNNPSTTTTEEKTITNPFSTIGPKEKTETTSPSSNSSLVTEENIDYMEKTYVPKKGGTLGKEFWKEFLEMCLRIYPTKMESDMMKVAKLIATIIREESGLNPQEVAMRGEPLHPVAKGLAQFTKTTAKKHGITEDQWDKIGTPEGMSAIAQIPAMEKLFKNVTPSKSKAEIHSNNLGGYQHKNPKGTKGEDISYASKEYMDKIDPTNEKFINAKFQNTAYEQNKALDIILNPDGTLKLDEKGEPARKGYISGINDLSDQASKARSEYFRNKHRKKPPTTAVT